LIFELILIFYLTQYTQSSIISLCIIKMIEVFYTFSFPISQTFSFCYLFHLINDNSLLQPWGCPCSYFPNILHPIHQWILSILSSSYILILLISVQFVCFAPHGKGDQEYMSDHLVNPGEVQMG
jgi:hypothetical protein